MSVGPRGGRESGAAAVEMAIITPLLVLLLFGMVVFGIQLFRSQSMQAAAREGGRFAAIGETYDDIAARAFAEQNVAQTPAELIVGVTRGATSITGASVACDSGHTGDLVEVEVKVANAAAYSLWVPFFGAVAPDFESVAVFRCE